MFLTGNKPLCINGIEIKEAISNEIDLDELKKKMCLRVKKYADAIFFGQVEPRQMI